MGTPSLQPITEIRHDGGFIVSLVGPGHLCFDQIALAAAASGAPNPLQPGVNLTPAGTVLGAVTTGSSAAAVALGTNVGNGTFGAITLTAVPSQVGVYVVTFTDATHFTVTAPDGSTAVGVVGSAFAGLGIGFTISAGGTPMAAGDLFDVTATQAATGAFSAVSVAGGSNVGNATSSAVTCTGPAAALGNYTVNMEAATLFSVMSPNGVMVGHGITGTVFNGGGLSFTLTAGGTPFTAADAFVITVAAASGANFRPWDLGNSDGSQFAVGILFATKFASAAAQAATMLARLAEVNASELIWPVGASVAQIAIGTAQLKALGIVAR